MATLSEILAHTYSMIMVFFSIILLQLVMFVRGAVGATERRPMTTEQFLKLVEEKIPACLYDMGVGVEPLECSVCLSLYKDLDEVRELKCNHTFHKNCLDTWLQQEKATCPLCRCTILPEEELVVKRRWLRNDRYEYYEGSEEEIMILLHILRGNFLHRNF